MSTFGNALRAFEPADDESGPRPTSDPAGASEMPSSSGARSGHGEATRVPELGGRIEKLTQDLDTLAAQNRKLLTSVSHLLDLYEAEKAQRLALQTSLDRAVADMTNANPAIETETLAEQIRRGVSDDLKPLLHAILDVLEISMRRSPADLGGATRSEAPAAEDLSGRDGDGEFCADDDLPRALPEILTRPVEELVAPSQSRLRGAAPSEDRTARAMASSHGTGPDRPTKRRSVLPEQPRRGVWIPVTSDKTKR